MAEMSICILDPSHRHRKREVQDSKQGDHKRQVRVIEIPGVSDQERRHRRSSEIVKREPSEIVFPDKEGRNSRFEMNGQCN